MKSSSRIVCAVAWAATSALPLAALAQQPETATPTRVLAANCANCHGTTGTAQGAMPSLAGQSKIYMIEQMKAFRDGKRPATIMHQLAKGYTDQQIEAVAEFFSQQKPSR